MEGSLLPCPFCGGKATIFEDEFRNHSYPRCTKCYCTLGSFSQAYTTIKKSVNAWNRRSPEILKGDPASHQHMHDIIALLGEWHRAYHSSRDDMERVDDKTVAVLAQLHHA